MADVSWHRRRSDADFVAMVKDLIMAGPIAERELVAALPDVSAPRRLTVVAALGDAQGEVGPHALRQVLADPKATIDTRCAALLALAKRDGVGASPELADHLNHRSRSVRSYAMRGLAVVGDDRAWTTAIQLLRRLLNRPTPTHIPIHTPLLNRPVSTVAPPKTPSLSAMFEAMVTITYLVRHLDDPAAPRRDELVRLLRARFDRFHRPEQDFLIRYWPGCQPDGPDPQQLDNPDPAPFRAWARDPLFGPIF